MQSQSVDCGSQIGRKQIFTHGSMESHPADDVDASEVLANPLTFRWRAVYIFAPDGHAYVCLRHRDSATPPA